MASERASHHTFFGVSALLFAASAALMILWCASMSAMRKIPMPGTAASFLRMWCREAPRRRTERPPHKRQGVDGSMPPKYDLLLAGRTLVDPAQGVRAVTNVAFAGDRVAAVGPHLSSANATETIDCSGRIVAPGMIDQVPSACRRVGENVGQDRGRHYLLLQISIKATRRHGGRARNLNPGPLTPATDAPTAFGGAVRPKIRSGRCGV